MVYTITIMIYHHYHHGYYHHHDLPSLFSWFTPSPSWLPSSRCGVKFCDHHHDRRYDPLPSSSSLSSLATAVMVCVTIIMVNHRYGKMYVIGNPTYRISYGFINGQSLGFDISGHIPHKLYSHSHSSNHHSR